MDKKIISLWFNGRTIEQIAEILNTTEEVVNKVVNQKIFYEEG